MDQANLLLIPIEIARIISILIHGSDHREHKQGALKQVLNKKNFKLIKQFFLHYSSDSQATA